MVKKRLSVLLAVIVALSMFITVQAEEAQKVITESGLGTHDGYDYELWKDSGTTSMTLKDGGAFTCEWSDINNALFRKGFKFDETKTYEELGNITVTYDSDYNPDGNSYLCVYGWTVDPLVEYYIVDSWGDWRPPGATPIGTVTVDDGTYDVYETTRTEQPSIKGTATFQQYWSVRTSKRESGAISVSEHFKAWESLGLEMGKMYEASLLIEGYQSKGTAEILSNTIEVGGSGTGQSAVVVAAGEAEAGETASVALEATAAFRTPALDGKKDDIWERAEPLNIGQMLQGPDAAHGIARVLWDTDNLYVLIEAEDKSLDNTSGTVHEKDSIEVFVDETNCKLGAYQNDDGQYRVCYDGSNSFGDSTNTDGFESVAAVDGTNYLVEMKIPFKTIKPDAGMKIGFDAQVNDAENGARTGIAKWNDASDNSWQDTSGWGVVTLLASDGTEPVAVEQETAEPEAAASETAPPVETSPDTKKTGGINQIALWTAIAAVAIAVSVVFIKRKSK